MLKRPRLLAVVAAIAVQVVLAAPAFGAECIGITAPNNVKVGGSDLVLNGMGIRMATMLQVKVYVGSLYLPEKSKDASHILGTDQPWELVLRFVRDVDVSDMRDALQEGFEKAAGNFHPIGADRPRNVVHALVAEIGEAVVERAFTWS
jgi:hypothetical protein